MNRLASESFQAPYEKAAHRFGPDACGPRPGRFGWMARCALALALAACAEGADLTLPVGGSGGSDSGENGAGGADSALEAMSSGGAAGSATGGAQGQGGSATGGSSQDGSQPTPEAEAAAPDTGDDVTPDAAINRDASADAAAADVRDSAPVDATAADGARDALVDARTDALADAGTGTVGLEAYYRLDEGAGTVAMDATGHNHTANVTGGWTTPGRVGPSALLLNGTGDSAVITGAVVNTTRPYTVAAWVQLTQVNGFRTAMAIEGANVSAFFLQYRSDTAGFAFAALPSDAPAAATAIAMAGVTPVANTWYHIAGIYDGGNLKFYLNGVLRQTVPYTTAWLGTGNTVIGRSRYNAAPADFWPGLIDEVRIYSRALTDAEVAALAMP